MPSAHDLPVLVPQALFLDHLPIRVPRTINLDVPTPATFLAVQSLNHRVEIFALFQIHEAVVLIVCVIGFGCRPRRDLLGDGAERDAGAVLRKKLLDFLIVRRLWLNAGHIANVESSAFGLGSRPVGLSVRPIPAVKSGVVFAV